MYVWVVNLWLVLNYVFNPAVYFEMKRVGEPCYVYVRVAGMIGHDEDVNSPPPCWDVSK